MKYKVGQILRVKKGHEEECGAFNANRESAFIKITDGTSLKVYQYDILNENKEKISYCDACFTDDDLEPIENTLETLEVGDRVRDEDGDEKEVLAVVHRNGPKTVYVMSFNGAFNKVYGSDTAYELEEDGFTLVEDEKETEEILELTVKQVEEKFGQKVKIVKEKE